MCKFFEHFFRKKMKKHKKKPENIQKMMFSGLIPYYIVPRAGVEPARLAASVFETDLSTDSNIWAKCGCKGTNKS